MRQQEVKSTLQLALEKTIQNVVQKKLHAIHISKKGGYFDSRCDGSLTMFLVLVLDNAGLWPTTSMFSNYSIKELCEILENCSFDEFG